MGKKILRKTKDTSPWDMPTEAEGGPDGERGWESGNRMLDGRHVDKSHRGRRRSIGDRHRSTDREAGNRMPQAGPMQRFAAADENNDGSLNREEWVAKFGNDLLFDVYDRDGDGTVDAREWMEGYEKAEKNAQMAKLHESEPVK